MAAISLLDSSQGGVLGTETAPPRLGLSQPRERVRPLRRSDTPNSCPLRMTLVNWQPSSAAICREHNTTYLKWTFR